MLTETELSAFADLLYAAERDRAPVAPLIASHPGLDVADAYRIQLFYASAAARPRSSGTRWVCRRSRCSR